jgi:hypothetical protein
MKQPQAVSTPRDYLRRLSQGAFLLFIGKRGMSGLFSVAPSELLIRLFIKSNLHAE